MNGSKKPKAYSDGKVEFYGREFLVDENVLIPRPETETAIDLVLSLAGISYLNGVSVPPRVLPVSPQILDVGTGSGCIAIMLKLLLEDASVTAVDISKEALNVAQKNADRLGARVRFFESDLLENVKGDFDVIVANLPYVDENWEWLDKKALSYEPNLALYAKDGGLELIFKLIRQTRGRTKYLILEADPLQHERIKEEARKYGYEIIKVNNYQLLLKVK